jgi:hypothetical protein
MSLYVIGMNTSAVRTATEGPEFVVGTIGRDAETGKMYKYVKYDNGTAVTAVAGNFVYYIGETGTTVTMDLSDSKYIGAGVLQAVIADLGYGWIQVAGQATLTTALTAGADGNALTPIGSTDGTLDVSAAVTDHICAIAVTAASKIVYLTCPL